MKGNQNSRYKVDVFMETHEEAAAFGVQRRMVLVAKGGRTMEERVVVVIRHTSVYRGDHSDPVRVAHIFPETATLKEILAITGDRETTNDWIEIPLQGN